MSAPHVPASALRWLDGVLWAASERVAVVLNGTLPERYRPARTYAVLPSAERPRRLVPLRAGAATASAPRQPNDGMGRWARMRRAVAGLALRTPATRVVAHDRLVVGVDASAAAADLPDLLLEAHLGRLVGRDDLAATVSIGAPRPHQKPVLQLATSSGNVVGYVKVAWNGSTTQLLQNETDILRGFAARPATTFVVPRLLREDRWHGHVLAMTSPLPPRPWRRGASPHPAVLREIAAREGVSHAALASAPFAVDMRARAGTVPGGEGELLRHALDTVLGQPVSLGLGFAHGDWTPSNVSQVGGHLYVWDWERARAGVPIGIDALHFAFLAALASGRSPAAAAAGALDAARPVLDALEVASPVRPALLRLVLAELVLRFAEARAAGVVASDALDGPLLAVLTA